LYCVILVQGCVLVSACHTDLGIDNEREAGYYNRPWRWELIKANAGAIPQSTPSAPPNPLLLSSILPPSGRAGITQFHSDDDPFIPLSEAQHVACSLGLARGSQFHVLSGHSHFFSTEDAGPLLEAICSAVS
jgi:pimeloyl-ACP methyl ester carboxylesterase